MFADPEKFKERFAQKKADAIAAEKANIQAFDAENETDSSALIIGSSDTIE